MRKKEANNKLKRILKSFLIKVSPTFRVLEGNKQRMSALLEKIQKFENNSEQRTNALLKKFVILEKLSEQSVILLERVGNLEKMVEFETRLTKKRLNSIIENLLKTDKGNNGLISIVCLIYRSTKFAKAIHDSLYKYTPKLKSGEAELLFVANDATPEVIAFLKKENYNFVINNNQIFSKKELFELGYGAPEYINRVYKGYNFGIKKCKGDIVVLINSDNMFSPDWLENLLNKLDRDTIVCSQIVERKHPKFSVFPAAIWKEFGDHPDSFLEEEFISFANSISKDKLIPGGAYMPCMTYKDNFEKVGYYPEGNIAGKSFEEVVQFGDENLYEKLRKIGVEHITSCDSIAYHFKEGEKED